MNLTITPQLNLKNQRANKINSSKNYQQPLNTMKNDTVSFGNVATNAITQIDRLKILPSVVALRANDQLVELTSFVGIPLRRMDDTSFISSKAYSLEEIAAIKSKSTRGIQEELRQLAQFDKEEDLGNFVETAYKFNLKSESRPDPFSAFDINSYWFDEVMKNLDEQGRSQVRIPLKIDTASWDRHRTETLGIHNKLINPKMNEILKKILLGDRKFIWSEQTFPISYNSNNYIVDHCKGVTKLPEGVKFEPKPTVTPRYS